MIGKMLVSYDQKVPFVASHHTVNKGAEVISNSVGDEDGLELCPHRQGRLQSKIQQHLHPGDATNVPASKAGSVAH